MRRRVFLGRAAWAAAGVAAGAAAWKGLRRDPRDLRVVRASVPSAGLRSGEVRLLVFSDVDWPRSAFNWRRIPAIAAGFRPHLVLVPGDVLDRGATARDDATARAAADWLGSVAPGIPVLVAPGEAESPARERLAAAWSGRAEILANETRNFDVHGEGVEVFVADPKVDAAPWGLAREGARAFARTRGRSEHSVLSWAGTPDLASGFEAIFAFRVDEISTSFELRAFDAWRIRSRPGRRAFALQRAFRASAPLPGSTSSAFAPPLGRWCRARVRVDRAPDRAAVRARFWVEGDPEPSSWPIDAVDADPARPAGVPLTFRVRAGLAGLSALRIADAKGDAATEPLDDLAGFRARWRMASKLAAWAWSPPSAPTRVVLAHHPDVALVLSEAALPRPDLAIAGHTHGGQILLPGLGPLTTDTRLGRARARGLFDVDGTRLFITAGVGTSIVPARWNVPPDVSLLTLVPGRRGEAATLVDSAAPEEIP